MLFIKEIKKKDSDICFELDSNTISFWSKKQWESEFIKEGVKVFGLSFSNSVIGICTFQVILDEAQINYFVIDKKFQRKKFGTYFMRSIIKECEKFEINKLFLEVSDNNYAAKNFYDHLQFSTVGVRKNYYKDGSDALLKQKNLVTL